MKNKTISLSTSLLIIMVTAFGCKTQPKEAVVTLEVNSLKVPCEDVAPRTCLQVKYEGNQDWQLFYSSIEGFEYEQGYIYTIEVIKRERDRENRPMDVSSYTYHLKSVLEKTKDVSIRLNDIWGLKSVWDNQTEINILEKTFRKGYPTLELNIRSMKFLGHDGCNTFNGSIKKMDQTQLVFGNALTSLINCSDMETSKLIMKNLTSVNNYQLEDLQLVLYENERPLLKYQKID